MLFSESTLGILQKGYPYFLNYFEKQQTDILQTRLLLRKTLVLRGEEAAAVFYDRTKFIRKEATPKRFQKTLFGQGGVQGLDGVAHTMRKAMFMNCMNEQSLEDLKTIFNRCWNEQLPQWQHKQAIDFYKEMEEVLMRSACLWIGISLNESEVTQKTTYMSHMIDGSGGIGLRYYRGKKARNHAEQWIISLLKSPKEEVLHRKKNTIFNTFRNFNDPSGEPIALQTKAVEILNLIRPIVAIARYITYEAIALHTYPEEKVKLQTSFSSHAPLFIQEVRRKYPFFPFVAARVKQSFQYQGVHFKTRTRVLLDLYATNHHPRTWSNPDEFLPERFKHRTITAYNLIPQGGGDPHVNHRCAGEWITILLMQESLFHLLFTMNYRVISENLKISYSRIPALPKSVLRFSHIEKKKEQS